MSGGGLDAGGRVGCVRIPPARGSASAGRAVVCARGAGSPTAQEGALLRPPARVGELTLGRRLGSLTQIRHDKEGESGTWAEPGGSQQRGRRDLRFKVTVCRCTVHPARRRESAKG